LLEFAALKEDVRALQTFIAVLPARSPELIALSRTSRMSSISSRVTSAIGRLPMRG
jgi:hypothetical protein